MEPTTLTEVPLLCTNCHIELLPTYYFCPNCGTSAHELPLSTTTWTQTQLYMFSIILPLICFLTISKWKGLKYLRSQEKEARVVGIIACTLLVVSTIFTVYFTIIATEKLIQNTMNSVNVDVDGNY